MRNILYPLALLLCAAPAWAQSNAAAPDVLDRVSIFSQNRASVGQVTDTDWRPSGTGGNASLSPDRLIFAGVVVHEAQSEALLEIQSPNGPQFQMVSAGDLVGGFRVQEISMQRIQVSDGTHTFVIDLGHNLLNQDRAVPVPAAPASRPRPIGLRTAPLP